MEIKLGNTKLCEGQTRNNTGAPVGPRDIRDAETPGVVIREYVGVDRVVGDRVGCDHGTVTFGVTRTYGSVDDATAYVLVGHRSEDTVGALMYDEMEEKSGKGTGKGLAAFEKDGKRQLTQLSCLDGQWIIHPLGTNALYPAGDYRVTFDAMQNAFAVQYRLSDDETASFYLSPGFSRRDDITRVSTAFDNYERVNWKTGEAVWITVE